jgi:hypothetical protein
VELEVFTPGEAVAFLLARVGSTDQVAAAQIGELLGLLPLALEQAGAYMRETRLSLAGYLDRLRRFPTMTMTKGRPRDRDPRDTVATTWQLSLERVRPTPGAVALLEVCAFLDPEEIPRELFGRHLDPPAADLAVLAEDPFALDDAVAALRRLGLVKADEQSLTVHRLLQQVVGNPLDPATKAARVGVAVRLLDLALPFGGHVDPGLWPACAQLLPHALAATEHAEQIGVEPLATASLLESAASYLHGRARYPDARPCSSAPWRSARPAWALTTPTPPGALVASPPLWPPRATCPVPAACTSAPWQSAKLAWAPTTPTPPRALVASPPLWPPSATCPVPAACTSAPWRSARPVWALTTPTPPRAEDSLQP